MGLVGEKMLPVSQGQRASQSLTCLVANLPGASEVGTLNRHARSRGSPELAMGSQNVTAAMRSVFFFFFLLTGGLFIDCRERKGWGERERNTDMRETLIGCLQQAS